MNPQQNTNMFPEIVPVTPTVEYAADTYMELVTEIDAQLPPNHEIIYVPYSPDQKAETARNMLYAESVDLPLILSNADAIICISRDEDPNPDYTDQYPERNITLTPSGKSNVDKSVELFNLAQQAGNTDIKFISTGRMHNRAVRMILALPVLGEFIGINGEDAYHISETRFKDLLDTAFTPDNIGNLTMDISDENLGAHYKALAAILNDKEYGASVPTANSSPEEFQKAAQAIYQEYKKYPRISTSRLMAERAILRGVPRESIVEEDGAVDTISNLVYTTQMLESIDELKAIKNVVIVAGSDHLPRTTWIADHILPDGMEIISVESNPALDDEAYKQSCTRELNSFRKGSVWIGKTRDLSELTDIVEKGYFGVDRTDAAELAGQVAAARATASIK